MADTETSPFLIITGCPRSGTSLLTRELMRRYDVAIPFETHFIPVFYHWLSLYGDLGDPGNRRRLLADIYLFTRMWLQSAKTMEREKVVRASILTTEPMAPQIIERSSDYPSLCRAIFDAFARQNGATMSADKSVFFDPVPIRTLHDALGGIRVVNVIRDGRDVYLSWSKTWFGATGVGKAARLWSRHIENADRWAAGQPDDCLTVRYEDLVSGPDDVCARVADFFGLQTRGDAQHGNADLLAQALATSEEHGLLAEEILVSNTSKYASAMQAGETALFLRNAGETLSRLGYETESSSAGSANLPVKFTDGAGVWPSGLYGSFGRAVKFNAPKLFALGFRPLFKFWARNIPHAPMGES